MGVWIPSGWASKPLFKGWFPPFSDTFPDDESDVGVEDRSEELGLDLLTELLASSRTWDGSRR
jgi:hypothetical protein